MKNNILKNFVNYFIGDLFVKGFLFISLPLLSRVMAPSEYGKLSLVNTSIMILYVFISLNLQNAVLNRYMTTREHFSVYLSTLILSILPFQIILILTFPYYSSHISLLLQISESDLWWVIIICIQITYIYMYTSYLQASQNSHAFIKINITSKVTEIISIFILALYLSNNQYLSKIISQLIINIFLCVYIFKKLKNIIVWKFNLTYLKEALFFSIPLIIHVLSNTLLSQSDRLIINDLKGEYAAGIYSFSYNIGMAILVAIMAWNSSWQPKFYNLINNKEKKTTIKKIIKNSTIIIFIMSTLLIIFSKEFVIVLSSKLYYESYKIIPIIIIGNALIHIYLSYVNFLFYRKKSMLISIGTLSALVLNVYLNYQLVPIYGIEGAAWATVIAYIALSLFHYISATYFIKLNFIPLTNLIYFTISLLVVYLITIYIENFTYPIELLLKIVISLLFIMYVFLKKPYLHLKELE
ncbi:oligosaccharide flippase family protein [Proteus penneri]|uniref:oligosaccharide flippase family protein n=1 Tax=Proteus penneri TaxID=102862 RepID=UPI00288C1343|nr:oligosaccharide flippase family protein [Proteus penneri]